MTSAWPGRGFFLNGSWDTTLEGLKGQLLLPLKTASCDQPQSRLPNPFGKSRIGNLEGLPEGHVLFC